jgi:hypothetical protein
MGSKKRQKSQRPDSPTKRLPDTIPPEKRATDEQYARLVEVAKDGRRAEKRVRQLLREMGLPDRPDKPEP